MNKQQPTIGLTVHYVSYGTPGGEYTSKCRAATITEVGAWVDVLYEDETMSGLGYCARRVVQNFQEETCALMVANPTGQFFNTKVRHDEEDHQGGTWHHIH